MATLFRSTARSRVRPCCARTSRRANAAWLVSHSPTMNSRGSTRHPPTTTESRTARRSHLSTVAGTTTTMGRARRGTTDPTPTYPTHPQHPPLRGWVLSYREAGNIFCVFIFSFLTCPTSLKHMGPLGPVTGASSPHPFQKHGSPL